MTNRRRGNQGQVETADPPAVTLSGDGQLQREIELRAYHRYCERGCAPGRDVEDWLTAEQEVLGKQVPTEAPISD